MKAIVYSQYGSPDVLRLEEIEKPTPKADEVLVRVHAASANPLDWHLMRGQPFIARFASGLLRPNLTHPGVDVSGTVEAVGSGITRFKVGDEVFGYTQGSFAEYVAVRENGLVLKPEGVSFEIAAAVPVAAFTALQGLRDKGQIQAGQKVLINGASGGIGIYAVQIAKFFGAEVTGVCSTRNMDMVRSLGADDVIDYTRENFTQNGKRYDLILDNVANHSVGALRRVLAPQGICVIAGFSTLWRMFEGIIISVWASKTSSQKLSSMLAISNQEDLQFLQELLATGKITSVIDRCYPLQETASAIRYLETGHARGKVIVTVSE